MFVVIVLFVFVCEFVCFYLFANVYLSHIHIFRCEFIICYAFIKRRGYVIPEDVRAVVHDVLRHRIGLTYEAEAENITSVDIINKIVNEIEVP